MLISVVLKPCMTISHWNNGKQFLWMEIHSWLIEPSPVFSKPQGKENEKTGLMAKTVWLLHPGLPCLRVYTPSQGLLLGGETAWTAWTMRCEWLLHLTLPPFVLYPSTRKASTPSLPSSFFQVVKVIIIFEWMSLYFTLWLVGKVRWREKTPKFGVQECPLTLTNIWRLCSFTQLL